MQTLSGLSPAEGVLHHGHVRDAQEHLAHEAHAVGIDCTQFGYMCTMFLAMCVSTYCFVYRKRCPSSCYTEHKYIVHDA